ncbi:CHY zinc finger protein [Bacillus sp. P14.5]|uniref:CHY zinc finger protein n=1 Tax=Bacillus sp. P14.5 TaxID=1983400 RepID=UPI001F055BB1|nr:CHY zinc finger protein [Bacillus sp. P14.5]
MQNSSILIKGHRVKGTDVDTETRCRHYHTDKDIIAIKFKCCNTYYPCHLCHKETAGHPAEVWGVEQRGEKAILCGSCGHELTIDEYMNCGSSCPECSAVFNSGCSLHYHLYFEIHD